VVGGAFDMEEAMNPMVDTSDESQLQEAHERCGRHYKASILPIFRDGVERTAKHDDLRWLYGEICTSWRMLTDVRFKLLGFVPTVSLVILINLLPRDDPGRGLTPAMRMAVSVFDLLITLALFIYERRNSELYDDLASRGRRIEQELGIDTGQFLGRKDPRSRLIKHDVAINLIYGTALAGWLFALAVNAVWLL
jgi:hypothetical protein